MGKVITIGLDIAKSVFQVHDVDDVGTVGIRKRISRSKVLEFFADLPPCFVGIEACPAARQGKLATRVHSSGIPALRRRDTRVETRSL